MDSNNPMLIGRQLAALSLLALLTLAFNFEAFTGYLQQKHQITLSDANPQTSISTLEHFKNQSNQRMIDAMQLLLTGAPPRTQAPLAAPPPASVEQCATPAAPQTQLTPSLTVQTPPRPAITLAASEKKILLAGDSLMQGVAPHVQTYLRKQFNRLSTDLSKQSTGLLYPHRFNWPETLQAAFATGDYQTAVIFLGANDTWDIHQQGRSLRFGSDEWKTAYGQRVASILQAAKTHGVSILWLAAPPMGREDLKNRIPILNEVYAQAIAQFPETAVFIPTGNTLTVDGSTYSPFMTLPQTGEVRVRTQDGVHFTPIGQRLLAQLTFNHLKPPAPPHTGSSQADYETP